MSVVAVKVYDNKIKIASDSIVVRGHSKRTNESFDKLVKVNKMIIGACGDCADITLMQQYAYTHRPSGATEKDIYTFMFEFAKWKEDSPYSKDYDTEYIIIYEGKAFGIEGLYIKEITNYFAIGAGCDFATAVLHLGHSPKKAVKVACEMSCLVSEPIIEYEVKI